MTSSVRSSPKPQVAQAPRPATRDEVPQPSRAPDSSPPAQSERVPAKPEQQAGARRAFQSSANVPQSSQRSEAQPIENAGQIAGDLRGLTTTIDDRIEELIAKFKRDNNKPKPKPPPPPSGGGGGGGGGGAGGAGGAQGAGPSQTQPSQTQPSQTQPGTQPSQAQPGTHPSQTQPTQDAPQASAQITSALRDGFNRDVKQLADERPDELKKIAEQSFPGKVDQDAFVEQARSGKLPQPSKVRFVDGASLNGNRAAYDKENGGSVLLDNKLLDDPKAMQRAYNEEVAHHIDQQLGGEDSAGDEGEIFARGVQQKRALGADALREARNDDDRGAIDVDGQQKDVEFSGRGDFRPNPVGQQLQVFGQQGELPGDALPPGPFQPLSPQSRQWVAQDAPRLNPGEQLSTRNGGLRPNQIETPTPAEVARGYEHLANAYEQARQQAAAAVTPEQRIAAQRALEDVKAGMEKLADRAHMLPEVQRSLMQPGMMAQAQLDQQRKQFLDDVNDTKTKLDPERDDIDAIAQDAKAGDASAQQAWQRTRADAERNGDTQKLAAMQRSEHLAGEDPEQARATLDKLAFAKTPEERERLLKDFDKHGGVSQKKRLDELKVQDAVQRFAEGKRTDADRAALKKELDALPDDNVFKHQALRKIEAEEHARANPPKPGEPSARVEGVDSLVREVNEAKGGDRVDVITRGLSSDSSSKELAAAREQLKGAGTDVEKAALHKVTTQEALSKVREGSVEDGAKTLRDEAKANNPYARAALATALRGGAGKPGTGTGTGTGTTRGASGDGTTPDPVSMGRDDARVRLPEMSAKDRAAMLHAAADAFADGKMSRDEAQALTSELARTNDRGLEKKLQQAIDTGIANKNAAALAGLADSMALDEKGVGTNEKLVDTFLKGKEMREFSGEVGKLGRAAIGGSGAAIDTMSRLAAEDATDRRGHADFAEQALVRSAKAGHAEDVTRSLTQVPETKKGLDAGHYYRALGKAAAEWKGVDGRHRDEVMRELEGGLSRSPRDDRELGVHEGAAQGLAAIPEQWRPQTNRALANHLSKSTLQTLESASPRLSKEQATDLKGVLLDKVKHGDVKDPKAREETVRAATAVGQLGRWANADDVKAMADKLGKMPKNADGFSAFVNMASRLEDPAAKDAAKEALFDKANRWESLNDVSMQDRKKLAEFVTGSGDDALSADVQKLIYGANIRPPVAGLMKQWGVSGTPEQRRDKALAARAHYGDDNVRKLGARTALWNSLSAGDRADALGWDKAKLSDAQKAQLGQTVDPGWAAERAADGTLHQGPAKFLLDDLEGKVRGLDNKHAQDVSRLQGEMRDMVKTRERDMDALVKMTKDGVSFGDDVGHVLSYLNPASLVYGRRSSVDEFADNQGAGVRNLQRHDRALADKAKEIGAASQRELFTSTARASFDRETAMAEGHQREADRIALDQWKQHGEHLRSINPEMYAALHKRGNGDPRQEGAWERLHRNGDVKLAHAPEFTGTPEQKRNSAYDTLKSIPPYSAESDAVRKHALHTIDTDPSLQRMQEAAGVLSRGLPDVQKMLSAGMEGRKYQDYVDDLRGRTEPLQKALEGMKRDAPEIQKRLDELKKLQGDVPREDGDTHKAIQARIDSMQGMLDMVNKGDGTKALLDTVMDKSKMDADTWGNWLTNEGPKVAAGLAVGVGAAALCVATAGAAAPFCVVALAASAGGAAGGLLGYEAAREGMHALRNNFDPDVTSGKLKWGDRSRLGSYMAGEKLFDPKTGEMRDQSLWGDVVKPYGQQFAQDFAMQLATMGLAKGASGAINKVLARNPALANRLGSSMSQLEATLGKEGAKRTMGNILKEVAKGYPRELAGELGDEVKEQALEKALNQIDPRLGMASSVLLSTGKGVNLKGGGYEYDGKAFNDTVDALKANGFKVTHDAQTPGRFFVDTPSGPVTFNPTQGTFSGDQNVARASAPASLPDAVQNDPRVLRERAAAAKEIAQKLDDSGNLDPDVTERSKALRDEAKRLEDRATRIAKGETVDADPSLNPETKPVDANKPGIFSRLAFWRRAPQTPAQQSAAQKDVASLEKLGGFSQLSPQQQGIAKEVLGLKNDPVFGGLQNKMHRLVNDSRFQKADAATQAQTIRDVLADSRRIPEVLPGVGGAKPVAYSQKAEAQDAADAQRFHLDPNYTAPGTKTSTLKFDEGNGKTHDVRVVRPDSVDPKARGRLPTDKEVADALAKMPPEVRAQVKTVVLNPTENPDDAYWRSQPGFDPNHVSAMTADSATGTVHVYPVQKSYDAQQDATTLAHEVGHFVSNKNITYDTNDPKWDAWKKAEAADEARVSRYSKSNAAEDFSETYALYSMTRGTPQHDAYRRMMPERFKMLDGLFGQSTPSVATPTTQSPSRPSTTLTPDRSVDEAVRRVGSAGSVEASARAAQKEGIAFRSLSQRDIAQILDDGEIKARGTDGSPDALRDTVYYDGNGKSTNSKYTPTTEAHPKLLDKGDPNNFVVLDANGMRSDGKYRTQKEMPKEPGREQWVAQQAHTAAVGNIDAKYMKRMTLGGVEYSQQDLADLRKRVQKFDSAYADGDNVVLTQSTAPYGSVSVPKSQLAGLDLSNPEVQVWLDPTPPGGGDARVVHAMGGAR